MTINSSLVSILMPCFNSSRFINEAIESVIFQTHENWELLICDDGSQDNSLEIISSWALRDSRIKSIDNTHGKGAPGARNSCLDAAKGRYIAFLDSDDRWKQTKLEKQLLHLNEGVVFSFSSYQCISEKGSLMQEVTAPRTIRLNQLLLSNFFGCLTVIYDSNYFGKVYQPSIKKRNDYALWLKMLRDFPEVRASSIAEPLAEYRVNSYGLSSNKFEAIWYYYKCIREFGGASFKKAILLVPCYLCLIFIKKLLPNLYNAIFGMRGGL